MRLRPPASLLSILLAAGAATTPAAAQADGRFDGPLHEATLSASDSYYYDWFGYSVSISGKTALIGAPNKDYPYPWQGEAYVFVKSPGSWGPQALLTVGGLVPGSAFGKSVSLDGDTALIGAPGGDHPSVIGSAYVFTRSGTVWTQEAELAAPVGILDDRVGSSVAVCGDTALVGAPNDSEGASLAGAVYVFVRSGSTWVLQAKLIAGDPTASARFGNAVALEGETALVGAKADNQVAANAGSAYVFVRSGSTWSQEAKLLPSIVRPGLRFGHSVSLSGDTALVGEDVTFSYATVYAFVRSGTTWVEEARMEGKDTPLGDHFGTSVALEGDRALIGASTDEGRGAAYLFERFENGWVERSKLTAPNGGLGDNFGCSVSLSETRALVGAYGVGGNWAWGLTYVFTQLGPPGNVFCSGSPGDGTPCPCGNDNDWSLRGAGCANGVFASGALLEGTGVASVTEDSLVLRVTHQDPSTSGLYFQGTTDLTPGLVWGDGLRCTGGVVRRLQVRFADAEGASSTTIPIAAAGGVSAGETRYYQLWYRSNVAPPCGSGVNDFNSSNGYRITWSL